MLQFDKTKIYLRGTYITIYDTIFLKSNFISDRCSNIISVDTTDKFMYRCDSMEGIVSFPKEFLNNKMIILSKDTNTLNLRQFNKFQMVDYVFKNKGESK
jgi:hypothetical protein